MGDNEAIKAKVINLLKSAERKTPLQSATSKAPQSIVGNGNIQAGRDVNINKREVIRNEFTPGPEHITPAQARKIQKLVEKAAEIEEKAGADRGKVFAKWWKRVKDQYGVPTYLAIPAHLGDHAIGWLTQQVAIMRPKLRRTDNASWRNSLYTPIWAKARALGKSKGEVYAIAEERLGVKVSSLTKLGEQNLKKLYNILMAMD